MGYYRAGFDIVGVDIKPQPRYPFEFMQADAMNVLATGDLGPFDAIHASPPCQAFSPLRAVCKGKEFPDLISNTRELLIKAKIPYVIENVPGAPIFRSVQLCGAAFGLRTYRHRNFECSFMISQPEHPKHRIRTNRKKQRRKAHWEEGGFVSVVGDIGRYVGSEAMGIDWMTGEELSQAIPPAYTEFIGKQLMRIIHA